MIKNHPIFTKIANLFIKHDNVDPKGLQELKSDWLSMLPSQFETVVLFSNLSASLDIDSSPAIRRNLNEVVSANDHIHGALIIGFNNKVVSGLGYFGPDDVCFNQWLAEFSEIVKKHNLGGNYTHTFDEGEQGQPAYKFEKSGRILKFSIVNSEISDGKADPDWQEVEVKYWSFISQIENFYRKFYKFLSELNPSPLAVWKNNLGIDSVDGKIINYYSDSEELIDSWLLPWIPIDDIDATIGAAINAAIMDGHALFGLPLKFLATNNNGDYLVEISDGSKRVATIHFTSEAKAKLLPWNSFDLHSDLISWKRTVMLESYNAYYE